MDSVAKEKEKLVEEGILNSEKDHEYSKQLMSLKLMQGGNSIVPRGVARRSNNLKIEDLAFIRTGSAARYSNKLKDADRAIANR